MAKNANMILSAGIFVLIPAFLFADTIHLKNGYEINGKVSKELSTDKVLVIQLGGMGNVTLPRNQVSSIDVNELTGVSGEESTVEGKPVPAALEDLKEVHIKKGTGYHIYYGDRPIYGVKSPESTDQDLILLIPGAGKIQIPQAAVEKIEPADPMAISPRAVPALLEAGIIKTTHVVELKNGEKIRGKVVPGPESEPLKLDLDSLGRLSIPRDWIEKIEEAPGEIVLPEPPPEVPAEKPVEEVAGEEIIPGEPKIVITMLKGAADPELQAEIDSYINDLARWRSRNRVNAERNLLRIGAQAIPYLEAVARHPFNLTRRAVLRIIRDVADPAGIPMAIEALLDEDDFVREFAAEALREITGLDMEYEPYGSMKNRYEAYQRWLQWLRDHVITKA